MVVRHIVEVSNVDEHGLIVDPASARHGVIVAGRLWEVSGPVDPLTHLNRDFRDHALGDCVVAETLRPGARMLTGPDGMFVRARTRLASFASLGRVDVDARRLEWLQIHHKRRGAQHDRG